MLVWSSLLDNVLYPLHHLTSSLYLARFSSTCRDLLIRFQFLILEPSNLWSQSSDGIIPFLATLYRDISPLIYCLERILFIYTDTGIYEHTFPGHNSLLIAPAKGNSSMPLLQNNSKCWRLFTPMTKARL